MAVVLDELIRTIELWLRGKDAPAPRVNPDLDPVLLVPGIAGSILHAVDEDTGKEERVWVRILNADHEFRTKLWSQFDPATGKTVSMDKKTRIFVPEDRHGLYAIDTLDPDMIIGRDSVCYYHDMIEEMVKWGFQEGKTLFGFGYDFRQSNRLPETLDLLSAKLESAYNSSGGKKLNIITHSMGGLLVKCFMCLHGDIFEKYVKTWIAIAAPFQGAPGYITTSLLNGMSFVEGWEQNFFISKWSMHQLLIECPSIYELMACPNFHWESIPLLQVWREMHDGSGNFSTLLESYGPSGALHIMKEALLSNTVGYHGKQIPLPLNIEILKWANETREILSRAKLTSSVKFYNIYGINNETPHSVCYGSEQTPISDVKELLLFQARYVCVNGDGTVPAESAKFGTYDARDIIDGYMVDDGETEVSFKSLIYKADGFNAAARVGVPADHRGIVCDRHVFRILKHWLKAGEPDPFYNPVNDYVILPTAFEIERHSEQGVQATSLKEEWEIISQNEDIVDDKSVDHKSLVGNLSVSCIGEEQSLAEGQASIIIHPKGEGKQHVEMRAVSIATGA